MATFYILMENGDRIQTEDGNDLLVQEEITPAVAKIRRLLTLGVGK